MRNVLLTVVVLVAAACDDDEADPDAPREEPVLDISTDTGDPVCMQVTEVLPAEVETLPVIDCAIPHTHEIYRTIVYDLKDVYPGLEELEAFARVECLEAFETFVGRSQFDSALSYTWLVPTLDGWNSEDDRDVLCVLRDRDGDVLVGSMRDANV